MKTILQVFGGALFPKCRRMQDAGRPACELHLPDALVQPQSAERELGRPLVLVRASVG